MPRGDVASMAPDRRRRLLRLAAREFATAGYERASLNRVLAAGGMSKSSFYHYLGGKEALFDLVVSEATAAMADALTIPTMTELRDGDFWTAIARLLDQLLTLDETDWFEDFGRMVHLADAPPASSLARFVADIHSWLEQALAAGRAQGAVRTDLPASLQTQLVVAVLLTMDRWSLTQHPPTDPATRHQLAAVQLDTLRRLLDPAVHSAGRNAGLR